MMDGAAHLPRWKRPSTWMMAIAIAMIAVILAAPQWTYGVVLLLALFLVSLMIQFRLNLRWRNERLQELAAEVARFEDESE